MKLPGKERVVSSAVVIALAAILIVLAALQYRWSGEISEAASDRMRANLQASMIGLREELSREMGGVAFALRMDLPPIQLLSAAEEYVQRVETWKRTAAHPELIANVFVWKDVAGKQRQFLHLNFATRQFEPEEWPARLVQLQSPLQSSVSQLMLFASGPQHFAVQGRSNFGEHRPPPGFERPPDRPGPHQLPWAIEENLPALIRPEFERADPRPGGGALAAAKVNWIIVELNSDLLRDHILPELAEHYFGGARGLVYDVAVVTRGEPRQVVYSSDPEFGKSGDAAADARLNLFGSPGAPAEPPMTIFFFQGDRPLGGVRTGGRHEWLRFGFAGPVRFETLQGHGPGGGWELIVKHRKGSLEAAVLALRHRSLAISFGILALLAITLAMVIVATRRAQRLARLQIDFVAGVSHELRTPLAVIASAADNIADGIVEDKAKLARYGVVIREHTRQLTWLVEQILLFAATRQGRPTLNLVRVQPVEIVEAALMNAAELIRAAGVTVEQQIEADLPDVIVDLPAASQCLQNLIVNAVKYGGEARWIGVFVGTTEGGVRNREIQIRVEDQGIGIEPSELQRIFEPFYRSPAVTTAQIRGTGLGLALAKHIAEAMGGRLTVTSRRGQGSSFVLCLPCAEPVVSTDVDTKTQATADVATD